MCEWMNKKKTEEPIHAERERAQEQINANRVMRAQGQNPADPAPENTRTREEILDDLMSDWEQLEHGEKELVVGNFEETKKTLRMVREREAEKREKARRKAEQEAAERRIAQQRAAEQNAMREAGVNQQEDELFFPKNRGALLHEVDRWLFQIFQRQQSSESRKLILDILKCPEHERMAIYYLMEHGHRGNVYATKASIVLSQLNYHPNLEKMKACGLNEDMLEESYIIIKSESEEVLFWNHMGKTYSFEQLERRKEMLKKDSDNNAELTAELLELLKLTKDDDDEREQLMSMIGEVLSRRKVNLENDSKVNDKMLECLTKMQKLSDQFYEWYRTHRTMLDSYEAMYEKAKYENAIDELEMQLWRDYREYQWGLIYRREAERKQQNE